MDYIRVFPPDYTDKYNQWLSKTEANVPGFSYLSYFSKRPLENAAAGSINIFNIRDEYDVKYINEAGFYDMNNCIFIREEKDFDKFYNLDEYGKEFLRRNAYGLVKENYTPEVVWSKIFNWVESVQ